MRFFNSSQRYPALFICFFVLSLVFFPLNSVHAKQTLVIGVEDIEYFPLWAKREGVYSGYAREFFDAFGEKYNYDIQYKPLPIKRLYVEFFKGNVDIKFPDNAYWAKDKKAAHNVVYSEGLIEYIDGAMVTPLNKGKGETSIKKLGTVRGFTPWTYMDQVNTGQITLQENSDLKGLVKLAKAQRVDAVYFNVAVARYFMKHTLFEDDAIVFDKGLPHTADQYHASSINRPEVLEQINTFVKNEAELIAKLKEKFEVNL